MILPIHQKDEVDIFLILKDKKKNIHFENSKILYKLYLFNPEIKILVLNNKKNDLDNM